MATSKHSSIAKAQSIAIPSEAKRCHFYGSAKFSISTDLGSIAVEFGRCRSIRLRGTPEAIIGFGLMLPEWLPGLPGNNATTQRVAFDLDEPRLLRDKAQRSPLCITIKAWGGTVEVQAPLSSWQITQLEQFCQQQTEDAAPACATPAPDRQVRRPHRGDVDIARISTLAVASVEIDNLRSLVAPNDQALGGVQMTDLSSARILRLLGELRGAFAEACFIETKGAVQSVGNVIYPHWSAA